MSDELNVEISANRLSTIVKPAVDIAIDGITIFRWKEDSLKIDTIHASNAMVVRQRIASRAFESYDVSPEGSEIVYGTKCVTISNLLKAAQTDDVVKLELNDERRMMGISFSDVRYKLGEINPDTIEEPDVPELELDVHVTTHTQVFERAYQVIGMISDTITFEVSNGQFRVEGSGDVDSAEIQVLVVESEQEFENRIRKSVAAIHSEENRAQARYGSEFINHLNDFTPSGKIQMGFSEDRPMRVSTDRWGEDSEIEVVLAPKMDNK